MTNQLIRIVDYTKDESARNLHMFHGLARGTPILAVNNSDFEWPQWPMVFFYDEGLSYVKDWQGKDNYVVLADGWAELKKDMRLDITGKHDAGFFQRQRVKKFLDVTGQPYGLSWKRDSSPKRDELVYCADEIHFGRLNVVDRLAKYLRGGI